MTDQREAFEPTAVQTLLRACGEPPPRRAEPRLAARLASVDQQRVPSADGSVAAWRVGDGPAVLLVHGWGDDNSLWAPLIDALAERGRSLVAFDMPGHGFSDGEWGLDPQAGDGVLATAAALGPIDAVVGHSSGAGYAVQAIQEGVAVKRAVLVAPSLGRGSRWLRYAERLGMSPDVAVAAQAVYEDTIGPARAGFDLATALPALDADVLVIHSIDDEHMPFGNSQEVVPRCPRAELVAVNGLTHRKTARDPEVVARIADFVSNSSH